VSNSQESNPNIDPNAQTPQTTPHPNFRIFRSAGFKFVNSDAVCTRRGIGIDIRIYMSKFLTQQSQYTPVITLLSKSKMVILNSDSRTFSMQQINIVNAPFGKGDGYLKSFTDGPKRDKGQLFLQIDLPDNPGAEDALAEKIWRSLHDSYYNCDADDQYLCFEEALKKANESLEKEKRKREKNTIGRINAIALLIDGNTIHFSQTGEASLYLQRGSNFSAINESEGGDDTNVFTDILSGDLVDEDRIVLATRPIKGDHQALALIFGDKASKISTQLKSYAKNNKVHGLISYFILSITETGATEEITEANDDISIQKETGKKNISILSKHLDKEKFKKAQTALKNMMSGVSTKFGKIAKKPSSVKNVNRRFIMMILIAAVFLFGIVILFQSDFQTKKETAKKYENMLSDARNFISIAEQRFLIGEKSDATEFLNKASTNLDQIGTAGFFQGDIDKLNKDIIVYRDSFDAIIRVDQPTVLADLSSKGSADALGLIHSEDDKNVVYEPRRLFETYLDKVQDPQIIDTEEIVIAGWELEDFKTLPFITQNGQVIEYRLRNGTFENMNTLDTTWKKGIDIKTFHGEFIYLLDTANTTIWKYRRLRNSYSKASAWASSEKLKDAVSLAIDGDIYVLLRDGTIMNFRKGEAVKFTIKDQPTIALKSPTRIFTFAEAINLYVLDSQNKRVVVYSKGRDNIGRYQKQVIFDSFKAGEIRDIYIDKDEQKLSVLTSDKIYITDL